MLALFTLMMIVSPLVDADQEWLLLGGKGQSTVAYAATENATEQALPATFSNPCKPRLAIQKYGQPIDVIRGPYPSPDGKLFAYVTMTWAMAAKNSQIVITDNKNANPRFLRDGQFWDESPIWSPDGKTLHFLGGEAGQGEHRAYRVNVDGGGLTKLDDLDCSDTGLVLLNDGSLLCASNQQDFQTKIWSTEIIRLKAGKRDTLIKTGNVTAFAANADRTLMALCTSKDVQLVALPEGKLLSGWKFADVKKDWAKPFVTQIEWRPDGKAFATVIHSEPKSGSSNASFDWTIFHWSDDKSVLKAAFLKVAPGTVFHGWMPANQIASVSVKPSFPLQDEDVRKLAKFDLDAELAAKKSMLDIRCLDVVPAGETMPREAVFAKLGINEQKLGSLKSDGFGKVVFLHWRISPSYDIVCMTGAFTDEGLDMSDPQRSVYGIRIVKHGGAY